MATTTRTHDYMGRALINASPGATDPAKDYMGRNVGASNVDYIGRALQIPA
jgi:hypothetical protein